MLFERWYKVRDGTRRRRGLQKLIEEAIRPDVAVLLRCGAACACARRRRPVGGCRAGAGDVDVRLPRGAGARTTTRRNGAASGGVPAQAFVRLSQRGGLPLRGAAVDGGADAAIAGPRRAGLPPSRAHRPSPRPPDPQITPRRLNGYVFRSGRVFGDLALEANGPMTLLSMAATSRRRRRWAHRGCSVGCPARRTPAAPRTVAPTRHAQTSPALARESIVEKSGLFGGAFFLNQPNIGHLVHRRRTTRSAAGAGRRENSGRPTTAPVGCSSWFGRLAGRSARSETSARKIEAFTS